MEIHTVPNPSTITLHSPSQNIGGSPLGPTSERPRHTRWIGGEPLLGPAAAYVEEDFASTAHVAGGCAPSWRKISDRSVQKNHHDGGYDVSDRNVQKSHHIAIGGHPSRDGPAYCDVYRWHETNAPYDVLASHPVAVGCPPGREGPAYHDV